MYKYFCIQYWTKSSHLTNFTLTPEVASATNIRYDPALQMNGCWCSSHFCCHPKTWKHNTSKVIFETASLWAGVLLSGSTQELWTCETQSALQLLITDSRQLSSAADSDIWPAMTGIWCKSWQGFHILKGKDDCGNLTSSAIQINLILICHQLWTEDIWCAGRCWKCNNPISSTITLCF